MVRWGSNRACPCESRVGVFVWGKGGGVITQTLTDNPYCMLVSPETTALGGLGLINTLISQSPAAKVRLTRLLY